ncbi:MAG TPA: PDZ domain-containing protein, partial [bacterium]|nr:PDZ domain-containing protein [bacterium]
VQPLKKNTANALKFDGSGGVIISEIDPGSSGEKGGFKKGDIITNIDGSNVFSIDDAKNMFRGAIPGEVYDVKVFREGKYLDLTLKLGLKG